MDLLWHVNVYKIVFVSNIFVSRLLNSAFNLNLRIDFFKGCFNVNLQFYFIKGLYQVCAWLCHLCTFQYFIAAMGCKIYYWNVLVIPDLWIASILSVPSLNMIYIKIKSGFMPHLQPQVFLHRTFLNSLF